MFESPENLPHAVAILVRNENRSDGFGFGVLIPRDGVLVPKEGCFRAYLCNKTMFCRHIQLEDILLIIIDDRKIEPDVIDLAKNKWEDYYNDEF